MGGAGGCEADQVYITAMNPCFNVHSRAPLLLVA